ncbi:MAG: PHP domain-containing protein [Treponema sp.]|nr:PHP domain-containing protein [Treponema sp.]
MTDLHTHSSASDGTLEPAALVKYACGRGIKTLALTDHDTTKGLEEAQAESLKAGITFVPGIEISVQWPTGEFHLLGLGLRHVSRELSEIISFLREERLNRNLTMAQRLRENGADITFEEVREKFNTDNIGRPHFAQVMLDKGIISHRQAAFDKYFAKGRPCYVDRRGADLHDAVEAIKSSGGIPVQAHPLSIYVSWGKMEETMRAIKDFGVMGLEAWHPAVRISEAERLEELAHSLGMIATGGSDFHGDSVRADRHIGFTAGGLRVPEKVWSEDLGPLLDRWHEDGSLTFTSSSNA